jgi:hypothetical protein
VHRFYSAPLLLIGESRGAGVAASAGSPQRDSVTGLLIVTPCDRFEHVAVHHYRWRQVK